MTTTSAGGELLSFKLEGIEKIHQGEEARDDNGKDKKEEKKNKKESKKDLDGEEPAGSNA